MRSILVPVDFSPFSLSAAKAAVFVAQKINASIHLFHVVKAPADWSKLSVEAQQRLPDIEALIEDAKIQIQQLASEPYFEGCRVDTHVRGGIVYENIVEFATSKKMSMIVIGAHGSGETDAMFIGSTTQRVIHMASCPVLSVKKDTVLKSIEKILFLSNFEEDVAPAIDTVRTLAALMHAEVDLLYVNTPGYFTDTDTDERRMARFIPSQNNVKFQPFIYDDFDRDKGMLNFMKRRKPDLVAMITHQRKGKPSYCLSVTDTLLFHSDVPVLSLVLQQ